MGHDQCADIGVWGGFTFCIWFWDHSGILRWFNRTSMSRSSPCLQTWAQLIFSSLSSLQTTTGLVVIHSLAGVLPLLLACNSDSRWLVAQSSSSVNLRYFFLKSSVSPSHPPGLIYALFGYWTQMGPGTGSVGPGSRILLGGLQWVSLFRHWTMIPGLTAGGFRVVH